MICDDVLSVMDLNNRYRMDSVLCIEQRTLQYNIVPLTLYSRYFQCTLILYSERICINWVNRYRLDGVLKIDQCTLQYRIRLFNSILKISFSVH